MFSAEYEMQKSRGSRARACFVKQKAAEAVKRQEKELVRQRQIAKKERYQKAAAKKANPVSYADCFPPTSTNDLSKFANRNHGEDVHMNTVACSPFVPSFAAACRTVVSEEVAPAVVVVEEPEVVMVNDFIDAQEETFGWSLVEC